MVVIQEVELSFDGGLSCRDRASGMVRIWGQSAVEEFSCRRQNISAAIDKLLSRVNVCSQYVCCCFCLFCFFVFVFIYFLVFIIIATITTTTTTTYKTSCNPLPLPPPKKKMHCTFFAIFVNDFIITTTRYHHQRISNRASPSSFRSSTKASSGWW